MLSRVLGLVRELIFAWRFGTGPALDAYRVALSIPDTIFALISGGGIGAAFIPVFTRLRNSGKQDDAWRMAAGIVALVGVAVAFLGLLAWVFAPQLVRDVLGARAENEETKRLATGLLRVLMIQPVFLALASVMTAILQAHDRFGLPAIAPVIYNLWIILGAVLLSPFVGIYGVAVGVVIGSMFFLGIQVPAAVRLGLRLPASTPLRDPNVRRTFGLLAPRIVGQAAAHVNTMVAAALALSLGTGRAASYGYASVLFVLPVGLFGTSVATAAFPALSREAGEKDLSNFVYLLRRSLRAMLFFIVPASVGLLMLRQPVIALLYERGQFTAEDVLLVAEPLFYFCLGMWAYAVVDILPRAFYALQDTRTPVAIAVGAVILDIALSFILIQFMGLGGLALAFSIALTVQVFALLYALHSKIGFNVDRETQSFLLRTAVATGLMLAALWLARPLLAGYQDLSLVSLALRVAATTVGGFAVYVLASVALRQEEVGTLARMVRR
ncbi:MAG: murein biosynthesis integral membrane protein MurJ [Chloroflexota bacterium]|nr:murein biosynthesis integral membrane protein MurJ [Chloroflexota bacterium]